MAARPATLVMAAVLRGEPVAWPHGAEPAAFLDLAGAHGVQPLLAHRLHGRASETSWPDEVCEPLKAAARQEAVAEVVRRRELRRALAHLDAAGVGSLLMKGAALAYVSYPHPALRPRCDADLLVRRDDGATAIRVLQDLGYRRWTQTPGDLVMPQCTLVKDDPSGVAHACDLHTKIANPAVFSDLLSFDEAAARAVAVPALGGSARALGPFDALIVACIHRVAHHHDSDRLLWLYDIHLLASAMDRPALERFAALAAEKRVRAVAARGLTLARQWLATDVPDATLEALAAGDSAEPSAAFVGGPLSQVAVLRSDLGALAGWPARWRLLRQHLFPPPDYMRARYEVSGSALLPALYALRALRGVRHWLRRPSGVSS